MVLEYVPIRTHGTCVHIAIQKRLDTGATGKLAQIHHTAGSGRCQHKYAMGPGQWYEYHTGTCGGGLRRGQSGEVRRPRQLHPVYPGDCGGDPRCRHRCRVGTVVYRDVFYAGNAH
jgi:hypothetical protein